MKRERAIFTAIFVMFSSALVAFPMGCGGGDQPMQPPLPPPLPTVASATPSATPTADPGPTPPNTPHRPVEHVYWGTKVTDDYEWLENPKNAEVKAWSDLENTYARTVLDGMSERPKVKARVSDLLTQRSANWFNLTATTSTWLAMKDQPPKQQPMVVAISSLDDPKSERVIVDPNTLDPSGKTAIDWFVPSHDGKLLAVSLSQGGSESGDVHIYDVATGAARTDVIARVNGGTAGGDLAWNKDASGFWYTRYPHTGERPEADLDFYQQVYFHKLGTTVDKDAYVIGKDFPRIAEVQLATSPDGNSLLCTVANGDGGEFMHFVAGADGKFTQLSKFADKWATAHFGVDGALFITSHDGAPRSKILRLKRPYDLKKIETIVPEGDGVIQGFVSTAHTLYVSDLVGGPSRLRAYSLTAKPGTAPTEIAIPAVSAVEGIVRAPVGDDVVFRSESYLSPPAFMRWDAKKKTTVKTAFFQTTPASMDDVEVVRDTCSSKDGTKVPINILRKKGTTLDGSHPALLNGYGGYSVNRTPRFRAISRLWLDAGGVYADTNLRGGGEFGEAWHQAGNLTNKQNVFDDFYACEKYLIDAKYTQSPKLAIIGGSNGGLLMGATLVQHPEMAHVVISYVGIYDMLRVELSPNGAFNVTEFGTVTNEAQFKALYAYSPLQNVKDQTAYPAILMLTGANDPRVDPYHSRKFTARLQVASSSGLPILLRTSGDTGHGIGTPLAAEIEEDSDVYAFLLHELGASLPQ